MTSGILTSLMELLTRTEPLPEHTSGSAHIKNACRQLLPVVPVLVCFLWASFYGLNFGVHWDEATAKFLSIKDTLQTGVFLQGGNTPGAAYNYGGLNYLLTWAGFAPEISHFLIHDPFTLEAFSAAIRPGLFELPVKMRVRKLYLLLCALSIVWLYSLTLVLGRSRIEALLAAAILAASWEFAYHSRWIAPDVVMMQFALLSFLCLAMGMTRKTERWFYFAAVAAGLATGTKYTGALVLPFVVAGVSHMQWRESRSLSSILKWSTRLIGMAVVTFVTTSPGILLDPFHFVGEIKYQQHIYATSWFGYTVRAGLPHLSAILKYFSLVLFSHYWFISVVFALFCIVGLVALTLELRSPSLLAIVFTVVYVGYFSAQAVMIVRNLLVVVPFLCLGAARGIIVFSERLGTRSRLIFATILAISFAVNYGWEVYSAVQIKHRYHPEYFSKQFLDYVSKSPSGTVLLSTKLLNHLQQSTHQIPQNLVNNPDLPHSKVAFLQSEGPDVHWENWPSNWWGMYEVTFGSQEVNLDAYPTFVGNERIIVTSSEHFKKLPLKAAELHAP